MPKSSSKSTQTQQSQNSSQQLNLENIGGPAIVGNNNTVSMTDYDAIENALNIVDNATEDALTFGGGAFEKAVDVVDKNTGKVINAVLQSGEDALTFAAGTVNAVSGFADEAISESAKARQDALTFAAGTVNANNSLITGTTELAIQASNESREDMAEFAAGALLATQSSFNEAAKIAERAQTEANLIIQQNNATTAQNFQSAFSSVNKATNEAFTFAGGAFSSAIDEIADSAERTQSLLTEFAGATIQTAVNSTKSESAQAIDKIIDLTSGAQKQILYAAVGLTAFFLFSRVFR